MTLPVNPSDPRKIAMGASLLVAVLMLVGKQGAFWLTGSAAIFSDAAESVVHIVATAIAAFAVWFVGQPADVDHRYGHGRFAYFSAGFEGALILIAALSIVGLGIHSLIVKPPLQQLGVGVAILAFLGAINGFLGLYLIRVGKRHQSVVVIANGRHVFSDMITTAAVVGGVLLVWATGLTWVDPVFAIAAGLWILKSAGSLLMTSFGGLMDRVDAQETAAIGGCLQGAVSDGLLTAFHQVRHRHLNDRLLVEAHLLFPGELSLHEAHARADTVEQRIANCFPGVTVVLTTHLEPDAHDQCHPDGDRGDLT